MGVFPGIVAIDKMKNAVFYLIIICVLAPKLFCTTAYSQTKVADDGSQQSIGNSVDSESTGENVTADKDAPAPKPLNNSANVPEKSSEDLPVKKPEHESTNLNRLPQARDGEMPPQASSGDPMATGNRGAYMYPFASTSHRPPSGNGYIIAGSVLMGIGGLGLGNSILLMTVFDRDSDDENSSGDTLLTIGLISSAVVLAVGIPLLIIGLNRRSELIEWQKRNPGFAGFDFQFSQHEVITNWNAAF